MVKAKWDSYVEAPRKSEFEKQIKTLCKKLGVACESSTVTGPWSIFGTIDTIFFKISGDLTNVQLVRDTVVKSINSHNNA